MPLNQTSGNVTTDAYGGGVAALPNYIEDVFSTWLYTGTGANQTITNGIDLSGKGGLVWTKTRTSGNAFSYGHVLCDTANGPYNYLRSNTTDALTNFSSATSFNSNGFNVGVWSSTNNNNGTYASWTFRKQPKFFDVVTYTGNGGVKTISHNLGSTPGCIIVKATSISGTNWLVYHAEIGATQYLSLNTTDGATSASGAWNNTSPTSTEFTVGGYGDVNQSGETYVAYLFANNAGGFGLSGSDNVITCGVYTNDSGSTPYQVDLGYEPQFVIIKTLSNDRPRGWYMFDNMRGVPTGYADAELLSNTTAAETTADGDVIDFNATGFAIKSSAPAFETWGPHIYIAIRRGPMKVPTDATKVFAPVVVSAPTVTQTVTTNFPVDLCLTNAKNSTSYGTFAIDRLRGATLTNAEYLQTQVGTAAGTTGSAFPISTQSNTSVIDKLWNYLGYDPGGAVYWNFRRAPNFFDEVCYSGNGSTQAITHNLGVKPDLMIVKRRTGSSSGSWFTYQSPLGASYRMELQSSNPATSSSSSIVWGNNTTTVEPTSTQFTVGNAGQLNGSSDTYVAYLFATCAGVSKVGSYTGNGSVQTINCGFTGGARFVLIKRTDDYFGWYVWDTARGMVAGTDPVLYLNTTDAETNANWCYTVTGGFQLTYGNNGFNANGANYIYLAIA